MPRGTIQHYNNERGFGFIRNPEAPANEKDLFFHITKCVDEYEPRVGDLVDFDEGIGKKGQAEGQNVRQAT